MIKYIKFILKQKGIFDVIVINKIAVIRIILAVLIVCTVAFIWSNSLETAEESSEMSSTVVEKVKPIIDPHDKIDDDVFVKIVRKAAHFSEFALLGGEIYLFVITFKKITGKRLPSFIMPIGFAFVIAVTDELLQLTSAGRSCQFSDMMIDLAGIITGVVVVSLLFNVVRIIISKVK